jgi:hypothetical protein
MGVVIKSARSFLLVFSTLEVKNEKDIQMDWYCAWFADWFDTCYSGCFVPSGEFPPQ